MESLLRKCTKCIALLTDFENTLAYGNYSIALQLHVNLRMQYNKRCRLHGSSLRIVISGPGEENCNDHVTRVLCQIIKKTIKQIIIKKMLGYYSRAYLPTGNVDVS